MSSTQNWFYGLMLYFIGITIIITLFSSANASSDYVFTTPNALVDNTNPDANITTPDAGSSYNIVTGGSSFWDYFWGFYVWDFAGVYGQGTLMNYFWIIRLLLVWLPLTALTTTFVFWVRGI